MADEIPNVARISFLRDRARLRAPVEGAGSVVGDGGIGDIGRWADSGVDGPLGVYALLTEPLRP